MTPRLNVDSTRLLLATLLLAAACATAGAQGVLRYNADKYSSAADGDDLENSWRYRLRQFPSLVGYVAADSARERNIITAGWTARLDQGDFLHYEGKHTTDAHAAAGGEMTVKGVGTLYGKAEYIRGRQRATSLSYAVHPEDYLPYLVGDTVATSDRNNERYVVDGGLSFTLGSLLCGVGGTYEGTASAAQTQPRRSVYDYRFRLTLSAAKATPRWLLGLKAYPEVSRQSISASSAVDTYRFAMFYGFGQFNRKESTVSYSYSRQQRFIGTGVDVVARLLPKSPGQWDGTLTAGYNRRWIQTEETSFKNLFEADNSLLTLGLDASRKIGGELMLYVDIDGQMNRRQGHENVYQQQTMNSAQHLYDYVKMGTNDLYTLDTGSAQARVKVLWQPMLKHALSMTLGVREDYYKEKYKMPAYAIENGGLTWTGSLGWQMDAASCQLDANIGLALHKSSGNKYDAPTTMQASDMAYTPYLLRGEDYWQATASVVCAHSIGGGRRSVGAAADLGLRKRTSAPYESLLTTSHKALALDLALFFTF